ncbi:NAD(+)/NADH kinase [Leifsonia sp. PS1209]|uniref:ATP-NAD kinase family protein n=1 Tax=Leifsonia sp. PS1209 TaxID=2724914 RepID=UPI001442CB19|nr:NAD(+)/NADH kinase [Leifsonia sp. PS1209]QIZ97534.1 ATP-NAD kinase [Leifsonia sp. PS1209]
MSSLRQLRPAIGVVVNPVAGIGGPAGLVGSDGEAVQREAAARGSHARAAERAAAALAVLAGAHPGLEVLTASGPLGEDAVRAAGLLPRVVYAPDARRGQTGDGLVGVGLAGDGTTGDDTARAVAAFVADGATLVLFAGGDGTARDAARGAPAHTALLGIPAGVKMYSGCFAVAPAAAGAIAAEWLTAGGLPTREAEVLDLDEELLRAGRPDPRLFALVRVPVARERTQARKAPTPTSEADAVRRAAAGAVAAMRPGVRYLLGPGGTLAAVSRELGVPATPLGVDIVQDGMLVARDVSEQQAIASIAGHPAQAVVTVIGGQGFLLGRGNQQLSPAVLDAIGSDPLLAGPLMVVATEQKLIDLAGRPLLVDTGDTSLDARLAGHLRVTTGPSSSSIYPVSAASAATTEGAHTCV